MPTPLEGEPSALLARGLGAALCPQDPRPPGKARTRACPALPWGPDPLPPAAFQWEKQAWGRPPASSGRGRGAGAAPEAPRSWRPGAMWGRRLPLRLRAAPLLLGRAARAGRGAGAGRAGVEGSGASAGGGVRSRRGGRKRGGGAICVSEGAGSGRGRAGQTDGQREPAERHRSSRLARRRCPSPHGAVPGIRGALGLGAAAPPRPGRRPQPRHSAPAVHPTGLPQQVSTARPGGGRRSRCRRRGEPGRAGELGRRVGPLMPLPVPDGRCLSPPPGTGAPT